MTASPSRVEFVRLFDTIAMQHRRTSPTAVAAATLAEVSLGLVVEEVQEFEAWPSVDSASRRARQLA